MLRLYRTLVPALLGLLRIWARISPGLREFLEEREGLLGRWRQASLGNSRIWFHVSSVGELEQARPVIEALGGRYSIVLSYFSPSVPRLVKEWGFVRHADYLPLDEESEMREVMAIIRPRLLVLNRYDLWPNHLLAAQEAGVKVVLINASTPPLGLGGWLSLRLRSVLFTSIDAWTFVDAAAAAAWEPHVQVRARGLVTGDPRVDRALARVEASLAHGKAAERLRLWKKRTFCVVAGSTWDADERVLLEAWKRDTRPSGERSLVIVPHEPTDTHVHRLEREVRERGLSVARFSELREPVETDVLLVDQRGFLAEIYGLGTLAYVGGGFGRQIHSTIEPAAHGLPMAFGPHFERSPEAVTLRAVGAGFALRHANARGAAELSDWFIALSPGTEARRLAEESLRVFLQVHRGAGERVAHFLEDKVGPPA